MTRHGPLTGKAAWLSLFAMLMIFIGPLISQSMPMEGQAKMAGMDMPGDMHMDMGKDMAMPSQPAPGEHAIWAKCGYCTLLFQCPALTSTPVFLSAGAPPPPSFSPAAIRAGHARLPTFPGARSRAPPILA